jgi:RND family efflux transporter MFP subunit
VKRFAIILVLVAAAGGSAWYYTYATSNSDSPTGADGAGRGGRGAGRGGGLLTVDTAPVTRADLIEYITVVGNLIGEATVDVSPRASGRIEAVFVKLGDRVAKGQPVAKMDDRDLREQVAQIEANLDVNTATLTQRESDLQVAKSTLDRLQATYDLGIASKQQLEDAQARHNSALAAVTVSKAQISQTRSRVDELKLNLSLTTILSPVDGFVGQRNLDPGAFAGTSTPILSVVDISTVRLVANLVEKDFRRIRPGVEATVEVDAFPGEQFAGQVSRVAPIFDPATRTAAMEIEVPNPGFRLKPGMFARIRLLAERRNSVLAVPRNAIVDVEGKRGVFLIEEQIAHFVSVQTGLSDEERVEILSGVGEGQPVVTTGALALRDGDRVMLAAPARGRGGDPARGPAPGRGR